MNSVDINPPSDQHKKLLIFLDYHLLVDWQLDFSLHSVKKFANRSYQLSSIRIQNLIFWMSLGLEIPSMLQNFSTALNKLKLSTKWHDNLSTLLELVPLPPEGPDTTQSNCVFGATGSLQELLATLLVIISSWTSLLKYICCLMIKSTGSAKASGRRERMSLARTKPKVFYFILFKTKAFTSQFRSGSTFNLIFKVIRPLAFSENKDDTPSFDTTDLVLFIRSFWQRFSVLSETWETWFTSALNKWDLTLCLTFTRAVGKRTKQLWATAFIACWVCWRGLNVDTLAFSPCNWGWVPLEGEMSTSLVIGFALPWAEVKAPWRNVLFLFTYWSSLSKFTGFKRMGPQA